MFKLLATSLGLLCLLSSGLAPAADLPADAKQAAVEFSPKEVNDRLRRLERDLDDDELSREQLQGWTTRLLKYQDQAGLCEQQAKSELEQVNIGLKTLPEDSKNDSPELKKQRELMNKKAKELTSRASTCALLSLNMGHVRERLTTARKRVEEEVLFRRDPVLWLSEPVLAPPGPDIVPPPKPDWREQSRAIWAIPAIDTVWLWSILGLGLGLGLILRFWVRPELAQADDSFSRRFFNAVFRSAFFYAPLILVALGALAYGALGYLGEGSVFWARLLRMAGAGLLILVVLESLTLGLGIAERKKPVLRRLRWSLRALIAFALPWYGLVLLTYTAARQEPAQQLALPTMATGWLTMGVAGCFGLSVWLASRITELRPLRWAWRVLALGAVVVILFDVVGYRLLARLLLNAQLMTLLVVGGVRLASVFIDDFFNALDGGHSEWQRRLRIKLGLSEDENIPGVIPLHIAFVILCWGAGIAALLRIWGLSDENFKALMDALTKGFSVGEFKIVPGNILMGILLFAVLLAGFRWLRQRIQGEWVRESKVSKGAREAIATIFWYAGAGVAAVAGISLAGIDLSSLAFIAGALSLGIGFGLQNVVSNFISGLILLLERPIRPGDWVLVGGTEGYVQKISIRATRIKTFDRSDVIVPNSEFITQQVTNRMLADTYGRVKLPIGVAYDSDVEKVRNLLLEILNAHPEVVKNDPKVTPPRVLFLAFADSSLNFELRAIIRNVEDTTLVVSDLNFAIEKAFRENGISIPFPQRELHIRYPDGVPSFMASPVPGVPLDKLAGDE